MNKFFVTLVLLKITLLASILIFYVSASQPGETSLADADSTASPTPPSNDNINRPVSEPYTGDLSIFEDAEREKNLQIDRVMDILKISDQKTVADIGAGSGWFTVRAARRVGDKGQVFAVEINQNYIDHITARSKKENLANIKTILGKPNDPLLPKDSVDAVLILKTYHEIADPIRLMKNLRLALRKDALVGIIDRNGNGDDHGLNKETVIEEAKAAGFTLKEQFDFVKADGMDYFLVFEVQKKKSLTAAVVLEANELKSMKISLLKLAHARSGDKGDTANVGLIALKDDYYPLLVREVTAANVKSHFGPIVKGEVERFELPNLKALNFLLHESLGGGGTLSLMTDAQGKTFSTALLRMNIDISDAEASDLGLA